MAKDKTAPRHMKFETVDEYFDHAPVNSLKHLQEIRDILKNALPASEEVISYNMPAFKFKKVLVYYSANSEHIGFYPTPSPIEVFKNELAPYRYSKGAIQFPYKKPLPADLIEKIAIFRLKEVQLSSSS